MHELLSVVLDFNSEVLSDGEDGQVDLETFVSSILKFLNLFRMQSGLGNSRIYLAFASNSYLIYPLEGSSTDANLTGSL